METTGQKVQSCEIENGTNTGGPEVSAFTGEASVAGVGGSRRQRKITLQGGKEELVDAVVFDADGDVKVPGRRKIKLKTGKVVYKELDPEEEFVHPRKRVQITLESGAKEELEASSFDEDGDPIVRGR